MSTIQSNKLEQFTGLRWYSGSVTFLFSFLAITSEPLLAAGIVLSAIDFLQRGQLLAHNPMLAGAWSIAQGLAMEVSVGPVLKNTLEARSENDQVKTWLYGVLAGFLFVVGGAMLFLQFTESIMGIAEQSLPVVLLISLFAFRTIASLGYIALACTKHVRFSGVSSVSSETNVKQESGISDETVNLILAKLATLEALEQRLAAIPVSVSEVSGPGETPLALLETGETTSETAEIEANAEPENAGDETIEPALDAQLVALLAINQNITSREAAIIVGKPHTTVYRALNRVKQMVVSSETNETEVKQR